MDSWKSKIAHINIADVRICIAISLFGMIISRKPMIITITRMINIANTKCRDFITHLGYSNMEFLKVISIRNTNIKSIFHLAMNQNAVAMTPMINSCVLVMVMLMDNRNKYVDIVNIDSP